MRYIMRCLPPTALAIVVMVGRASQRLLEQNRASWCGPWRVR